MRARKAALIPRAAMALRLGISTDRLFSYEAGRAKLPWNIGNLACRFLDVSQRWLATGGETYGIFIEITLDAAGGSLEKLPFSEVYTQHFEPRSREKASEAKESVFEHLKQFKAVVDRAIKAKVAPTAEQVARIREISEHVRRLAERSERKAK